MGAVQRREQEADSGSGQAVPSWSQAGLGSEMGEPGVDAAGAEQAPSLPKDAHPSLALRLTQAALLFHSPSAPPPLKLWIEPWETVRMRACSGEK